MMKSAVGFSLLAGANSLPEFGCYYFNFPGVEAQVDITGPSSLDFAVSIESPQLKMDTRVNCDAEKFTWDAEKNLIYVGEEPISDCLNNLSTETRGAVAFPVELEYIADEKKIRATFAGVPITLDKIDSCRSFAKEDATPADPITPTGEPTFITSVEPGGAADDSMGSTTKNFETLSLMAVMFLTFVSII